MEKQVLVTGGAGFIGFHVAQALLAQGNSIVIIDNLNDYYDVSLKEARLEVLKAEYSEDQCRFYKQDLEDYDGLQKIFAENNIGRVCHLAAQAGIRYSLVNPFAYIQSNSVGFFNVIESAKNAEVENFVYASSSSVYGNNKKVPFSVEDAVDTPISLYAATKRGNEILAYTYAHTFSMPCTGLRFFTAYGPWGRPDMALYKFTDLILAGKPIELYGNGKLERDFTYVVDIAGGVLSALDKPFDYEILNLGNHQPVTVSRLVEIIEENLGQEAIKEMKPRPPGDVPKTWADIDKTRELLGYEPKTSIEEGIANFISWYKEYHEIR